VYLERDSMRFDKQTRWTYVSGARTGDRTVFENGSLHVQAVSGPVRSWRRQQFEAPTEWGFHAARLQRLVDRYDNASEAQRDRIVKAIVAAMGEWSHHIASYEADVIAARDSTIDSPSFEAAETPTKITAGTPGGIDWIAHSQRLQGALQRGLNEYANADREMRVDLARGVAALGEALSDGMGLTDHELDRIWAQITAMESAAVGDFEVPTWKQIERDSKADRDNEIAGGHERNAGPSELKIADLDAEFNG